MSKRKSQTAITDYIAQGFIREALVNYLALLGWSSGTEEELFTLDELVERFDLAAVHKSGAVFDRERLEWLNGQWIRRLSPRRAGRAIACRSSRRTRAGGPHRPDAGATRRSGALVPMVRERLPLLGAIGEIVGFLFQDQVSVDPALLVPKRWDAATTVEALRAARTVIARRRRGELRGRRARAAAPSPGRGARLEGGRPVHGDPRRLDGSHRDAAAVRHAGRARARADARATRPGDRRARRGGAA